MQTQRKACQLQRLKGVALLNLREKPSAQDAWGIAFVLTNRFSPPSSRTYLIRQKGVFHRRTRRHGLQGIPYARLKIRAANVQGQI